MHGAVGGWRLEGHLHGGAGGLAVSTRETQTETGSSGSPRGAAGGWRLVAGGVGNTKDIDARALEVRAGTPGVGRTARDAAGLSSTNSVRVKVARTSVENGPQSLYSETEARIWPLLL